MAKKYREKPCNEVEAVQWTGKNISEVRNFTIKNRNGVAEQCSYLSSSSSSLFIMEPDKDVEVSRNDYIVKGTDGEFYVCERNVFETVYEEVKEFELANKLKKANAKVDALEKRISDMNHNSEIEKVCKIYERLAKDGIECTITLDDKNGICTIYCYGVELEDNSERISKSFEDVFEEEENDQ